MADGIRTCPACLMRVLPLADGMCPACRKFNFNLSPSDEQTIQAARGAKQQSIKALVHRAATLYWRVVAAFTAAIVLTVGRVYVRHRGTALFGNPPVDRDIAVSILSIGAVAAVIVLGTAATALARVISLASSGQRTPGVLTVIKESRAFFREHHVSMGWLGPRMGALAPPDMEGGE